MAKQKLTDLTLATSVSSSDLLYVVQANTSKSANVGTLLSSISTANITENGSNLYYTNARVRSAISVSGGASYDANTGLITVSSVAPVYVSNVNGLTNSVTLTTSNIAEDSNLYYTNARVTSAVEPIVGEYVKKSNVAAGNLYARVFKIDTSLPAGNLIIIDDVIKPEITLYRGRHYKFIANSGTLGFTITYLNGNVFNDGVKYTDVIDYTGNIEFTVHDTVPQRLNYQSLTHSNSTGNIYIVRDNYVDNANTANIALNVATIGNFNTDNLPESASNLYYTNARVRSAFVAGSNISISNGVISALVGGEPELSMINTFDFGTFENTLTSPLQYIFYSLGMDMGTFDSPAAFNIDLGNF